MKSLALLIPLFLYFACGAETGNGLGPTLSMRASQSGAGLTAAQTPAALLGQDAQGSPISVTSARVNVRHIELESPGGQLCVDADYANSGFVVKCDSAKIRIEGPIVVDLMTGASTPSLDKVIVPAATYKRIDVRLDDTKSGEGIGANDPLLDYTMVAGGALTYKGTATPYDLRLKFNEDARFESTAGVEVVDGEAQKILMLLDVSLWFRALPLTTCLDDGDLDIDDGRISIEDKGGRCSDIEKQLKDAIKGSSKLAKD
jgi:hypothetical protein